MTTAEKFIADLQGRPFREQYDAVRARVKDAKKVGGLSDLLDALEPWIKANAKAVAECWCNDNPGSV